jgi:hypothetical protein
VQNINFEFSRRFRFRPGFIQISGGMKHFSTKNSGIRKLKKKNLSVPNLSGFFCFVFCPASPGSQNFPEPCQSKT